MNKLLRESAEITQQPLTGVEDRIRFTDLKPVVGNMAEEVLSGLKAAPKHLSPKYFYDAAGAELFEQITELPEYYPTRVEMALLRENLDEIAAIAGFGRFVVEYGSGSSQKIRLLLQHLKPTAYMPIDISREQLLQNAQSLARDFPDLALYPTCADFTTPLQLPSMNDSKGTLGFFPGSSLGNFTPESAGEFLTRLGRVLGKQGLFLLGVDRKKDTKVLEAAYNDEAGVTARFNLNILNAINAALSADFDIRKFKHLATYDPHRGSIDMYLESLCSQRVSLAGEVIEFEQGERIHTEASHKYDPEEVVAMAGAAGFEMLRHYTDNKHYFSVFLFRVA